MRKPNKIIINENVSLKIALKKLNVAQEKLLICVNNNNKFVGVINDGDIRRSLINNEINVNTSIKNLINRKSTKIYKDTSLDLFNNQIDLGVYDKEIYGDITLASYSQNDPVEVHRVQLLEAKQKTNRLKLELEALKNGG